MERLRNLGREILLRKEKPCFSCMAVAAFTEHGERLSHLRSMKELPSHLQSVKGHYIYRNNIRNVYKKEVYRGGKTCIETRQR